MALGAAFVAHSASRKQPFVVVNMLARNAPLSVTYLRAFAISMSRVVGAASRRASSRSERGTLLGAVKVPVCLRYPADSRYRTSFE